MSILFWFRVILCGYIGGYMGSAIRNAFIETSDASLRIGLQDLSIAVALIFIYCYTRLTLPDKELVRLDQQEKHGEQ